MHVVLDLGAEEFTQGRPHPMIDPSVRRQYLLAAAHNPAVAVILCDVMLGWGAHADPAGALAAAWQEAQASARAAGRTLAGIAHVCGAPDDPQGFELQCQVLRDRGMILADSNAQAIRLAATVLGAHAPTNAARLLTVGGAETHVPQAQLSSRAIPAHLPELCAAGPRVINLGLDLFASQLMAHGVPVVHVDWRPPAGGDTRLANLLERLR
jgi:FdrA protein